MALPTGSDGSIKGFFLEKRVKNIENKKKILLQEYEKIFKGSLSKEDREIIKKLPLSSLVTCTEINIFCLADKFDLLSGVSYSWELRYEPLSVIKVSPSSKIFFGGDGIKDEDTPEISKLKGLLKEVIDELIDYYNFERDIEKFLSKYSTARINRVYQP